MQWQRSHQIWNKRTKFFFNSWGHEKNILVVRIYIDRITNSWWRIREHKARISLGRHSSNIRKHSQRPEYVSRIALPGINCQLCRFGVQLNGLSVSLQDRKVLPAKLASFVLLCKLILITKKYCKNI